MLTRTERVRAAIETCGDCFRLVGRDMRQETERLEELWFEVDDAVAAMERAEAEGDQERVRERLLNVLRLVERIERELPE